MATTPPATRYVSERPLPAVRPKALLTASRKQDMCFEENALAEFARVMFNATDEELHLLGCAVESPTPPTTSTTTTPAHIDNVAGKM